VWSHRKANTFQARDHPNGTDASKKSKFIMPPSVRMPMHISADDFCELTSTTDGCPDHALVRLGVDLGSVSGDLPSIVKELLPRVDGVIQHLPWIPLTGADVVLPTADAAYHSQMLTALDPLPRDPDASAHVQRQHAALCATESDEFTAVCADMMAGIDPDTTFIVTPAIGSGHHKETHSAVCEVIMSLSKTASAHFKKGDDRLMAVVWNFLPNAPLMHDPRGDSGLPKHRGACNRRCTLQRIKAIQRHGWAAVAALLLDWRAVALVRAQTAKGKSSVDPADKLAVVASHFARGVDLGDCLNHANSKPTDHADTATIATQFRLQKSDDDPPGGPPPLESFNPVALSAADLRKRLPADSCPTPWGMPDADGDKTNGHSADDIRNAMLASLRSIDTGAAPFVDGHTPATLKILLTHADGWKAGFSVVEAIDSEMNHAMGRRNYTDNKVNIDTGLFHALSKRSRASMTPKTKPGWRVLQIPTLAMSLHAGFVAAVTKPTTAESNGAHQLAGQPSGIDAVVTLEQTVAATADPTLCRGKHDGREHHNNIDHDAALQSPQTAPRTSCDPV